MDVIVLIAIIIILQIYFFVMNLKRMNEYRNIFIDVKDCALTKDINSGLVNGIQGKGNKIFVSIIASINKYLSNNTGSVIDFHLLKDTVDRHSDTVEHDIAAQTPTPLYLGLVGTMGGVILGLRDLISSGAILTLMSSSEETTKAVEAASSAAVGIDALLSGVAWAMIASIMGIGLTTANSLIFKKDRLKHEQGKDSFLAWMQADLLPELPTDTADAMTKMVKNLNRFNNTFKSNIDQLSRTFNAVNESYRTQADVIKAVHDMDVLKMAKANVTVLKQLEQCTDKLEDFNEYLESIKGYTDSIHRFETLFNENEGKYHVLQEIRDFFNRYKGSIASVTTDADAALKKALGQLKESTVKEMHDVNNTFVELSENFKKVIKDEKETFQKFSSELRTQFDSQMKQLPQLNKQLEQIAAIPGHLDKLVDRIEKANAKYADNLKQTVEKSIKANQMGDSVVSVAGSSSLPSWMKVTAFCALIIIAASCLFNVYSQLFPSEEEKKPQTEQQVVQSAQPEGQPNVTPANTGQAQPEQPAVKSIHPKTQPKVAPVKQDRQEL